uniref:Uncharacterized protein n=3 Tax=Amphimedon queenslandica TaxID=400682 RepID=A0A1X7TDZ2_AMPQE
MNCNLSGLCWYHSHFGDKASNCDPPCSWDSGIGYPELLQQHNFSTLIKHDVVERIATAGSLISSQTHQLPPECLQIAQSEFDHMLEPGIIISSSSSWSSALHMVPQKSPGDWHPCGDYSALNGVTVADRTSSEHTIRFQSLLRMFTRQPSLLHSGYISLFVCLLDYECSPDNPEVYYMVLYELHFSYPYIYDVSIASHVVDKNGISALDSKLSAVRIFPQLETPHKLRVLRVDKLLPPFYPPLCSGVTVFIDHLKPAHLDFHPTTTTTTQVPPPNTTSSTTSPTTDASGNLLRRGRFRISQGPLPAYLQPNLTPHMASGNAHLHRMARAEGHRRGQGIALCSYPSHGMLMPSFQDQNPDVDWELDVAKEPSGYALPMGMRSQCGDGPHRVSTPLEESAGKEDMASRWDQNPTPGKDHTE